MRVQGCVLGLIGIVATGGTVAMLGFGVSDQDSRDLSEI